MATGDYSAQRRAEPGAYERYLRAMDASMRQKVALTAAHLLCEGRVADMGMGSGAGSHALAALYPRLQVTGVDVSEDAVSRAKERYSLPNLDFVLGDVATPVFPPESLDGIFDSSVLHHVTSFTGYDRAAAARALAVQAGQLRDHGVLIVRDFVDPGAGDVLLDVPADDGDERSDDPRRCSTAALFRRFAREFRALALAPGFAYATVEDSGVRAGWVRFRVARTLAAEFLLRKDYRDSYEVEVREEYTYATQAEFEAVFARLGLRVLTSTPLRNPWIVRHRLAGRAELRGLDGEALEFPATNYVIVGERVRPDEGVRFREAGERAPLGFLQVEHYRDRASGRVRDVVRRPNTTLDVLPWFTLRGELYVLARMSYPRPILASDPRGTTALDESRAAHYVTQPLAVLQTDRPVGQTVEDALRDFAGIAPENIRGFRPAGTYYPSPGGVQEEVRAVLVEVVPVFASRASGNVSGFSTSGHVGAIEARQLLRAAQVGGLPDARLELNVHRLLAARGEGAGPWIGEAIALRECGAPAPERVHAVAPWCARPARRRFERVASEQAAGFLRVVCARFEELGSDGAVLGERALEFVLPRALSANTVACAPLRRHGDEVFLGLDDDDLPAAQAFNGNSELLVAPAWRLPREVRSLTPAREFLRARLREEYGLAVGEVWELGGRYHPSAGATPEAVYPFAVEVLGEAQGARALSWFALRDVVRALDALCDGHLRVVALRAAHALGLLERAT